MTSTENIIVPLIAHDLKDPIGAISGLADILLSNWNSISDDEKFEFVQDISISGRNSQLLLESLLTWYKEKKEDSFNDLIHVDSLVQENIDLLKTNASLKKINIVNNTHNFTIKANKNMISAVFRNLISNAIKFIDEEGEICISGEKNNQNCTFCISDNGCGLNNSSVDELLASSSAKSILSNTSANTGLGLILTKKFVHFHNGKLWYQSVGGIGTQFYFTIPLICSN